MQTHAPDALPSGRKVSFTLTAGGLALASKGKGRSLRNIAVNVSLERQWVLFESFPRAGSSGVYEDGAVRIQGETEIARVRNSARPSSRKVWWDDLDLLYFAGYALWNYVAIPQRLWELPHRELSPLRDKGQGWRRIEVDFPAEIHTHSALQTFYLDAEGRICRHDYVAEVFGQWARAAHFGSQHVKIGDAWVATRRRVVPRLGSGRALAGPVLVWIRLEHAHEVE